jgi:hypothetical protein
MALRKAPFFTPAAERWALICVERDEFRSLGVELVRDRLRLAAWHHEEKLQEARRWLWWQEHLVTIIVISMVGAVAIAAALIWLL